MKILMKILKINLKNKNLDNKTQGFFNAMQTEI